MSDEPSPSAAGDHVDGRASTFHGPVLGKGTQNNDYRTIVNGAASTDAEHELAARVHRWIRREVQARALENPSPIRVTLSTTRRRVQARADVLLPSVSGQSEGSEARLELKGDVTRIAELVRGLRRRQLVVLGEPGTGKSVAALLLTWQWLESRRPDEPVPVLLPLSSWRPGVDLRAWIVRQVIQLVEHRSPRARRSRLRPGAVERLLDDHRVMLVLDGLDELPAPVRAQAVKAIDQEAIGDAHLVVTCRGDEYQALVEDSNRFFTKAAVVELEPVRLDAAHDFLLGSYPESGSHWAEVFEELRARPRAPLAEVLANPLMLYLARTAYDSPERDPRELLDPKRFGKPAALEGHLLKRYVPTVYSQEPDNGRTYRPKQAGRWLAYLARQMRRAGTLDFAWWQIDPRIPGLLYGVVSGCTWGWPLFKLYDAIGVFVGVLMGFFGAAAYVLPRRQATRVYIEEGRRPRHTLRQYKYMAWTSAVVVAVGTATAVHALLTAEFGTGAGSSLPYGVGGAFGFATLLGSTWGTYRLSHALLAVTGRLPWRLMKFLDDAHARGVLRETGAAHQFRHVRLQRRLSGASSSGPAAAAFPAGQEPVASEPGVRRLKHLALPFASALSRAFRTLAVAGGIAAMLAVTAPTGGGLAYHSGDRAEEVRSAMCWGGESCFWRTDSLTWRLPPGSVRRTELYNEQQWTLTVVSLHGELATRGCAGATVEVVLTIDGVRLDPFAVADGKREASSAARIPRAIEFDRGQVTVVLRRVDKKPCTVTFSWRDPGVEQDVVKDGRRRLGE
ncbi:NACHT domain-containing protein [Streptomyces sp. NPDC047081]|uniref:NACHT domain-containing protein n=1 Tax=Streptomyces sp. NPDC047081 TaxID=3154706 RepID=UPI0033C870DA